MFDNELRKIEKNKKLRDKVDKEIQNLVYTNQVKNLLADMKRNNNLNAIMEMCRLLKF